MTWRSFAVASSRPRGGLAQLGTAALQPVTKKIADPIGTDLDAEGCAGTRRGA